MAQSVDYKLTEKEEINGKKEQVPNSMYTDVLKLIQAPWKNREDTQHGLAAMGRKLNGLEENIRVGVLTSVDTLIQNHTDQERKTRHGSTVGHSEPKMPHLGETKLEYPSDNSNSLPPGLVTGGGNRKLGVTERVEQKPQIKHDQLQVKDNDPCITWGENRENLQ